MSRGAEAKKASRGARACARASIAALLSLGAAGCQADPGGAVGGADAPAAPADAAAPGDLDAAAPVSPDGAVEAEGIDPATCALPALDELYPGAAPQNPWGEWPAPPPCAVARHDAIIILGCPSQDDGAPSACQQGRVDKALAFAAAGYGDRFIPTGGAVANAFVEAESMRGLLLAAAVPDDHIVVEPQAQHTDENLYFSARIMEERGWDTALVISEPEHLLYSAVCDADCCVELGRLGTFTYPVGAGVDKAASYFLAPPAAPVSQAECDWLETPTKVMCVNLASRLACADDFQL